MYQLLDPPDLQLRQTSRTVAVDDFNRRADPKRDDFITNVSHELRTPLTAIKGYSELLRMTASDKLDEEQLQFVDAIEENVTDLLTVIQQTLDLFQIEAGTLGIDRELINLAELIQVETQHWRDKMAKKNLTFTIKLADEAVWIEGDWNRLTWVVNNLLGNAYAYTPSGGKVQLLLTQEQGYARVEVKDTGVGIGKEDQRFLFERFFRGIARENTGDVPGSGLGLYVSKAIIEAHEKGKIWVETELNRGSTFSFSLPLIA
ncbi:MAG: HAMP domain-containing sensor histidine kinase [Chloroflexota bacterium]